eukprot:scaffold1467_cov264-Pinguiococcus_pyrenoidosus.AAC.9
MSVSWEGRPLGGCLELPTFTRASRRLRGIGTPRTAYQNFGRRPPTAVLAIAMLRQVGAVVVALVRTERTSEAAIRALVLRPVCPHSSPVGMVEKTTKEEGSD